MCIFNYKEVVSICCGNCFEICKIKLFKYFEHLYHFGRILTCIGRSLMEIISYVIMAKAGFYKEENIYSVTV